MSVRIGNGAIYMSYFSRIPNVGDMVNPMVVSALTGLPVKLTSNQSKPHLLTIGSIMAGATPFSQVWGTGVMHPDFGIGGSTAANIHALRGQLSHSVLRQKGIAVGDIALGDPGYLVPSLLGIKRSVAPKFRIGLVCHYVDRQHPIMFRMMNEPGVIDLNVHKDPVDFLTHMADCEIIISSSLHGLIFSEALGIPNLWVKAGDEIAGGEFKFQDWYSTTARPQLLPILINQESTAEDLARQAELRESTIDVNALIKSFPHNQIDSLKVQTKQTFLSAETCRKRPTPVFLISFNRGSMLKQVIAGIRQLSRPTEIIIHDNGSTDPYTLMVLDELVKDGVKVFRYPPIYSADDLNQVNETIQAFFTEWGEPSRYVVSDCDIDMSTADPKALDVYNELLNRFRKVECVGPMLRIRDIPLSYPLFNHVMNRHIEQFWHNTPAFEQTSVGKIAILETVIDTTFALHRAGEPFRRLKKAVRVYEPFEALHLDWYERQEVDKVFFNSSSPEISHWNNINEFSRNHDVALNYKDYLAIKKNNAGELEVYTERLPTD